MQQPPQGPYQLRTPQGQPPRYPQPGQQAYYPPQPGITQPPRNRKNIAIVCGTLFLLFLLIGSCNAIISGGKGVGTTDDTASQRGTTTVATMPPRAQPTSVPTTAPTQAPRPTPVPTQPPAAPTLVPTQAPAPTPVPTQAPPRAPAPTQPPVAPTQPPVNGNPWGYNFTPGNFITNPPTDFCSYFACITTFWRGVGHVEECQDTTYSLSGGISGSCSRHGGGMRPLYSH